jgi:hypothetical protein
MKTFKAGNEPIEKWGGETRDWVFDLLENAHYRERLELLAGLDLTRRSGCEPCLRALIMDNWDYESLYHLGWCDSCRRASFALGMDASTATVAGSPHRKRAFLIALAAAAAIAVPVAASQLLGGGHNPRGGVASPVVTATNPQTSTPSTTPGTTPTTTPATTPTTTPATTPTTTPTTTPATTPTTTVPVKPVPRSKPTTKPTGTKHPLPMTT